ncbi:MAG TPA: ester cyclase [Spirosoma sp.]|nr:ester cyclase [Spirosoma sp.]
MNNIFFTTDRLSTVHVQQSLPGFAEKYTNIVDYILKITHEIWEERGIGVIYDTYDEGITLHAGAATIHGINSVISGTLETLHAFPDRRLVGESVIWSEAPGGKFYTSHRIGSTATNLGMSAFGPATGKKAFFRTIADCVVSANRIEEEWLVRDNLHLVQQLGFDPVGLARQSRKYRHGVLPNVPLIAENRVGQYHPEPGSGKGESSAALVYDLFQTVWNGRYFQRTGEYYQPTAVVHGICDQTYRGVAAIQSLLINLFSSVPQAAVQVERVTSNTGPEQDTVAVRWRITGLHQGNGFFGLVSGKPVNILGISHFEVSGGKITQEWTVFDAFDVLCQIHAATTPAEQTPALPVVSDEQVKHRDNKRMVAALIADVNQAIARNQNMKTVIDQYFSPEVSWNGSKPFDELRGTNVLYQQFWKPFVRAFPDVEDHPYILMGGSFKEKDWVSLTGHYLGTFEHEWLGIPPTQQATWVRYGLFYEISAGQIVRAFCILDMLDVIRQAGFNLFPNRAPEITVAGPLTHDGILTEWTDREESRKTLQLTEDMIKALGNFDGVNLATMQMEKYWHPNMMWYGPAGTGSTRGLKGFQEYHQKPFLVGFPDRKGGHHMARFGDGFYSCSTGWPSIYATHGGDGWMGLEATHQKITMRVMDWWRREDNMLKENWVFIDKIDLLQQLGINVFELLKNKPVHA